MFQAEVHRPLHAFIDELTDVDRAAAQQVLLAKFDVESAVAGETVAPRDELASLLQTLLTATRDGSELLDTPVPDC